MAGEDAIGRRLAQHAPGVNPQDDIWYTVVGVVRDIHETSLMTPPEPTVYLPMVFLPDGGFVMWVSNMVAVVRTDGPPLPLLPAIRSEIAEYRPDVPITDVATLDQVTARSFAQVSFAMTLIGIAAGISLLLGMVGIYGTVSYVVGRRTREFGLRIALGASARDVLTSVLGQGGAIGAVGIVIGLGGALASGRVLEALLFGVSPTEPWVLAAVSALLIALVLLASIVPARRAASVDPMRSMRTE